MLRPTEDRSALDQEHVTILLADGLVLSFQERAGDVFQIVRNRIHEGRGRIRSSGADYLCYALIDAVVDSYFVALDSLTERVEDLEEEVLESPSKRIPEHIQALRRDAVVLRRAVRPMREALEGLIREEHPLVHPTTRIYFKDVLDHVKQLIEGSDVLREGLTDLNESYRSVTGAQANEVMKALTIVATLFIPLTFVAGIYGMNFQWMPELGWRWGYPAVWVVMVSVTLGMLRYFRRKDWI
jgi:magnesium transporter